ncbi:MAG: hypothetical protein WBE34_02465 [Candidatus Nitrosopolaris sp.]
MDTKTNESPTIKTSNINAIAAVMALLVVMMTNTMNIICIFLHDATIENHRLLSGSIFKHRCKSSLLSKYFIYMLKTRKRRQITRS